MGGVLARDFDILPEAASQLGMSEASLLDGIREDIEALMDGSLLSEEFWSRFSERSNVAVKGNPLIDLFSPRLDESTKQLIHSTSQSCRVVCGTNTMAEHYNFHKGRGDYALFDRVYASHLMGVAKPRTDFFKRILEQENVRPDETVFCDDLPENVESAGSLGIHSFLFTHASRFREEFAASGLIL